MDNWLRRDVLKSGAALGASTLALTTTTGVQAAPGEEEWAFETGSYVSSSPTVVEGTVFVGSLDNNLYAVDAASGEEEWAFETDHEVGSSPTVVDGTVFVGSNDKNLYAVDATTGEEEWAFETGDWVDSSPTVVDGTVFVGSLDNNLYAVDAASGEEEWAFETDHKVGSSPTVVDGTVFVGSNDKNLYAVDATTGEEEWAFETGGWVDSSPTVVDGTVFVGSLDNNLYAVDAATGEQEWAFETNEREFSSPTVVDGTVYVGSAIYLKGYLQAVDAATGEQEWAFETDAQVYSSPTVAEGTVFVGSGDTNLYAVDAATGEQEWAFETDAQVYSSPTVAEGTVFVGSLGGNLYAVDPGVSGSSEGSRVMLGTLGHHSESRPGQPISFNDSPTASITVTPTTPRTGEVVTFDASSSSDPDGSISTYVWSINGTTNTGEIIEHTFTDAGEYTAELTVTDDDGATAMTTNQVSVAAQETATDQSPETTADQPQETATDQPQETTTSQSIASTQTSGGSREDGISTTHQTSTSELPDSPTRTDAAASDDDSLPLLPLGAGGLLASLAGVAAWRRFGDDNDTDERGFSDADVGDTPRSGEGLGELFGEDSTSGGSSPDTGDETPSDDDTSERNVTGTVLRIRNRVPKSIRDPPSLSVTWETLQREKLIATGGYAEVYLASHLDADRPIAVKVPPQVGEHGSVGGLEDKILHTEADLWKRLQNAGHHEHIVRLFGSGATPVSWLALEYMDGGTLADRVEDLSIQELIWVGSRIADAVVHAHRQKGVHHDITPQNILFRETTADTPAWPKLADWGLAEFGLENRKQVDAFSQAYAAPEQLIKNGYGEPNQATDIYQLGAVLYEALTGEARPSATEQPTAPSRIAAVPTVIDEVIMRALEPDQAARYDSMAHFRDALERVLDELE